MAATSGMLLRALCEGCEIPQWTELAYPERKTVDTRTPEQIKADILQGLTGA